MKKRDEIIIVAVIIVVTIFVNNIGAFCQLINALIIMFTCVAPYLYIETPSHISCSLVSHLSPATVTSISVASHGTQQSQVSS